MLFYLNEGMKGGETVFPRWKNAETDEALKVVPEVGKAILFYNQLPDGNYDDVSIPRQHNDDVTAIYLSHTIFILKLPQLSQHAAMPVLKGEKWLTNLWVWVSRARCLCITFSALYE